VDRFTLGLLPSPVRWLMRLRRTFQLERRLQLNPSDRQARFELADLCIGQRRYGRAAELLRYNLEAGDDDVATLLLAGVAFLGAGHVPQGERLLDEAERLQPDYRQGSIHLERGRFRLKRGDWALARASLERFCAVRSGT